MQYSPDSVTEAHTIAFTLSPVEKSKHAFVAVTVTAVQALLDHLHAAPVAAKHPNSLTELEQFN